MSGQTLRAPLSPVDGNVARVVPEVVSENILRLGSKANDTFAKLKLVLDEMTKKKVSLADDKIIYDFVQYMKDDLSKYPVMKTWAGRRKRTRRR